MSVLHNEAFADSPSAFFPSGASPLPTSPLSFKSIYQLSVLLALFFNVNAKMALPFLTASFRSASSDCRELLMASKAAEEGKASEKRKAISKTKPSRPWI